VTAQRVLLGAKSHGGVNARVSARGLLRAALLRLLDLGCDFAQRLPILRECQASEVTSLRAYVRDDEFFDV
jgi:hypothetical protein